MVTILEVEVGKKRWGRKKEIYRRDAMKMGVSIGKDRKILLL